MKREVLEFSTVILVGIKVRCNYNAIIKLSTCESLLCLLAINHAIEFYKYLQQNKKMVNNV